MIIGIDARFFGLLGKGLGRYTQKLIEHLEAIDSENQYVVFLRKENFDEYQPFNKNFTKVLADYRWYSFAEQILYPRLLREYKFDLVHFPHFNVPLLYRRPFVLTIHDLILVHFPTLRATKLNPLWYWIKYVAYKWTISSAIKRAKSIIAVSEFTKNDILGEYPEAKAKINVTYEACDDLCRISSSAPHLILEKYGIIKPYLLYVGNAYPHKNLQQLIDAFAIVSSTFPDMQLALVGKEDFFYQRLKAYCLKKNIVGVHFLGFVSDQDLDVLYRFAKAYVFPSLYEGFGLPPLEAMAKGAVVVSSDHPCMREILEDAAWYVDAHSAEKFAEGIVNVLDDKNLRLNLIEKGYQQIKKYSWNKMAKETLVIYEKIQEKR
ncbi:MAG: glycosyl transferase, group 1 [Parcubacteria group bacterium GW2011_GWD2_38_11]|nr:MAG: glycosyl transferase, group 1 [Parcubacteria group bacterium GW2011_GWD2_38_11]